LLGEGTCAAGPQPSNPPPMRSKKSCMPGDTSPQLFGRGPNKSASAAGADRNAADTITTKATGAEMRRLSTKAPPSRDRWATNFALQPTNDFYDDISFIVLRENRIHLPPTYGR